MSITVELDRVFYSESAYIPSPELSLYYLTGTSTEITSGTYKGLYTLGGLQESVGYPQLYDIPPFGRHVVTSEIVDYSVAEDATTLNPSNYQGGSGQITVQTAKFEDAEEFFTSALGLDDSLNGTVRGTVRGLVIDDVSTSLTADSLAALFNISVALPTANTTLENALSTYFQVGNITIAVTFEDNLNNLPVRLPSQSGNMWDILKQIASVYQFEMAFIDSSLVVRKPRKLSLSSDRDTAFSKEINAQDVCKKVRVHYYQNTYRSNAEIYPLKPQQAAMREEGDSFVEDDPTIYTVDAGESLTVTLDIDASLTSVNQPTYVSNVLDKDYSGTKGVYSAVGTDGLPITPEQWVQSGGALKVRVLEDQKKIELTIIGPKLTRFAPYRIAMSSGDGNYYNSLHITGTGLVIEDNYIDLVTGATNMTTFEEIGLEVTNPYIDTLSRALSVGQYAAADKALQYTVSTEGYLYNPGDITFGKVAGARLSYAGSKFRVTSANTTPASSSLQASQDVLIKDVSQNYSGMTMAQVSSLWQGRTMLDFSLAPLKYQNE